MTKKALLSQKEMLFLFRPVLESEGVCYQKKQNVLAKKAAGGEKIVTRTSSGVETINIANPGDYIVQNETKVSEQYVVPGEEFYKKYVFLSTAVNGFSEYRSTGKIICIELTDRLLERLNLPQEFYFETDWNEKMIAISGDFIGGPPGLAEVYRLGREEFLNTYAVC